MLRASNEPRIKDAGVFRTIKGMYEPVSLKVKLLAVFHWLSGAFLSLAEVFSLSLIARALLEKDLRRALFLIVLFSVIGAALKIFMVMSEVISYQPLNSIRSQFFLLDLKTLTTMDLLYYEDSTFQDEMDISTKATSSNDTGLEGIYHRLLPFGADLMSWIALSSIMATLSPWLMMAFLLTVILSFVISIGVSRIQDKSRVERESSERKNYWYGMVSTDFRYGKDSRLYKILPLMLGYIEREIRKFKKLLERFYLQDSGGYALSFVLVIATDILTLLILSSSESRVSFDGFVLYITTLSMMSFLIIRLSEHMTYLQKHFRDVRRYFGYVFSNWSSASLVPQVSLQKAPEIRFEHVYFSYPGSDTLVLSDLSFTISQGKTVALVGINGAGKTTLVKLLMGLYRPDSGRIYIDNIPLEDFSLQDIREAFAVVFQEVEPLAITIAQHVSSSYEAEDEARIIRALKRAGIYETVESLSKGIHTPLTKMIDPQGAILSGGEQQKLMIARALYNEGASVMIMDEPTAALDALAEARIYREFDSLMEHKTAIFISHRLASTQFCDEIIFLDGGHVSERGTHQQLMALGGKYREMFDVQSKYYEEDL